MQQIVRWGILGPGHISRAFAAEFDIPRLHGNYGDSSQDWPPALSGGTKNGARNRFRDGTLDFNQIGKQHGAVRVKS